MSTKTLRLRSVIAALLLLVLCACRAILTPLGQQDASDGEAEEAEPVLVRIATCWSAAPLIEELAATYAGEANLSFDIVPSSSAVATSRVAAGRADLAIVERQPGQESESAQGTVIARNVVAVAVHKDSPLRRLTSAELVRVFSGHVLDWADLKTGAGRVELVSQETGTAARWVLEARIMGATPISSAVVVVPHDRGVLEYVAQHPQAIGYLSLAYVDERVRLLAIDDIPPTPAEVARGRYPLAHLLVMIVSPDAPREAADLLALAASERGRTIIENKYALP